MNMEPYSPATIDFINTNAYQLSEDGTVLLSDWDPVQQQYLQLRPPSPAITSPLSGPALEDADDTDFSETVKFMSQILMEENVEQRPFYDPLTVQFTENPFYPALTDDHINNNNVPLSPKHHPLDAGTTTTSNNSTDSGELRPPSPDPPVSAHHASHFNSHPISHTPSHPASHGMLDFDSSITKLLTQNIFSDVDSVSQFRRGLEEASKFLPPNPQLVTLSGSEEGNNFPPPGPHPVTGAETSTVGSRSRKNHEREESDREEGRSSKQSAASGGVDESAISDTFDRVLLNMGNMLICNEHKNQSVKAMQPSSDGGGKPRAKKQGKKNETIDLRSLLILCAQAVSASDNRTANELLKQIRQHSSPSGDASQRLAHYFANGLEARLAGDGSSGHGICTFLSSRRIITAEHLEAYQIFASASPFMKFALLFANKMITEATVRAEALHIIDFGILFGFQWPMLIKFLSEREGGPPKLKITGIDYPQPGFRPAERIEETGHRLARYCERFQVPFEYNAIASRNWETIQVEDLKIESNELLAVNSFMRFNNLLDETIEVNSPRNAVLHLIRKINPEIFVQSIVNGSYNAPFFATRFREALFHFSALYDMCDTVVPRENERRMMIEREFMGREAINVISCEGLERVERPETYRQWQVRNTRAGFRQLPLNEELMAKFRAKFREWYHRDFVFGEDNNWMLQGWKGRIFHASTCWVPA